MKHSLRRFIAVSAAALTMISALPAGYGTGEIIRAVTKTREEKVWRSRSHQMRLFTFISIRTAKALRFAAVRSREIMFM